MTTGQFVDGVGIVDKGTAQMIRAVQKVDAATQSMAGMDPLTASALQASEQLEKAAVSAKKTADEVREYNRVTRSGEGMSASLQRDIDTYGKTREEVRALRVEERIAAADRVGNTQLAVQLRRLEAELYEKQFAAARKASQAAEALAQDQAAAAAAAEREAQATQAAAAAAERAATAHKNLAGAVMASHLAQEADAAAAERLRASTDPLYATIRRLNDEIAESTRLYHAGITPSDEYARQQEVLTGRLRQASVAHEQSAVAAGKNSFALRQTALQIPDIVQGLLTGQHPMTIFIQQGGQIAQVAMMAEGGLKGFATQLGGLALRFAPVAAVAALATGAFFLFEHQISEGAGLDDYVKKLGLTKEEIAKLGPTSVTAGDIMHGVWKSIAQATEVDQFFAGVRKKLGEFGDALASGAKTGASVIYGVFVGAYRATMETWRQFPAVIGDFTIQGANFAIRAVEALVNATIMRVNQLTSGVNGALASMGIDRKVGQIGLISLPEITNPFAGAGKAAGKTFTTEIAAGIAEGRAGIDKVITNIIDASHDRLKAKADELIDARTKQAKDAAEKIKKAIDAALPIEVVEKYRLKPIDASTDPKHDIDAISKALASLGDPLAETNGLLAEQARLWDEIGRRMEVAFGRGGGALVGLIDTLKAYGDQQKVIDASTADEADKRRSSAHLQIQAYGDMASAAKDFFERGSTGYKVLADAEKAFRAVQFALSLKAMAQDVAETGSKLASGALRIAQGAVEAVVNAIKSLPFPANIAAGAATVAALAGIGVSILGAFGGGHNDLPKANTGTGTVLGSPDDKSASILHSLDALHDVDDATLTVSRDMLNSLRSIENSIGGLSTLLVRAGNIDANAGVNEGFNTDAVGSILSKVPLIGGILGGLFGTKTSVIGSGLYGSAQSLGDILGGGFDASYYSDVTKSKKLFGLTTSKKNSTQYTGADGGIEDQFTLLLRQFYDAIGAAAGPLGQSLDLVQSKLLGFTVDIGKIDLQGLSGTEIQEKLEAVFGAAADRMAEAALPGLDRFQKVGEGAFETLVRVSSTVEQVDAVFRRLGVTSGSMGVDVDMAIAGLFDNVSDFTSAADAYFQAYYSEAEQAAAKTVQMGKAFDSLGLAMPNTLAGFRSLVEAQDLTTAAGQSTYATLLQLAPAFADLNQTMNGTADAASILRERQDLEHQILQLTGDTNAIRADELSKIDVSNRALQQRIYSLQDEQAATDAARQASEAASKVAAQAEQAEQARISALAGQRTGLEGQILTLLGDTAEIRRREMEALDPSLRALQERIYALQDEQAATTAATQAAEEAAAKAKAITDERAGLEKQLLQLNGDTAALRELEVAGLDASNQALQRQIYALQDAQDAAKAADALRQAWASVGDTIMEEVKRIRGLSDTAGGGSFASILGQFNAANFAARAGDQDAAKNLPQLSKSLLDAAALAATSRQELDRVQAQTAAALEETYGVVGALAMAANAHTPTAIDASGATAPSQDSRNEITELRQVVEDLKAELVGLRADTNAGNATIAGNTRRAAQVLENVSSRSGGDRIATMEVAA